MTQTEYELRQKMIRYLDFLMCKDHIQCRSTPSTSSQTDMNDHLTSMEFNHVLKFLVRDMKQDKTELKTFFSPIIRSSKPINKPSPEITGRF